MILIGTGVAASVTAMGCREEGWSVPVINYRPFGRNVRPTRVRSEKGVDRGQSVIDGGIASADVILNVLARRREPERPADVLTPGALALRSQPLADCARYDTLRERAHATA